MRPSTLAEQVQMVTTRLAASVLQLRQNTPVDALRQDLLGQFFRHRRQLVVVVDTPVVGVEGNALGSHLRVSARLERVVRVKFLAQLSAAAAGSKESSVTVLSQRPEPEPPAVGAQRRLRPLLVVWVETSEVLEAPPHMVVESMQSITVEGRRNSSDGENHFAERRTVAEELQGNL